MIINFLRKIAIFTTTPQVSKQIKSRNANEYLNEMGYSKIGWRAIRRNLFYFINGQEKFHLNSIELIGKKVVWIYLGENQIGDALMDLAPRSLLKENGYIVDLLTTKKIASLFKYDEWFNDVIIDNDDPPNKYDFAIVISKKHRSLKYKIKYFKKLPWVSILESFSGPDFNRASYATQRVLDLINLNLDSTSFEYHSSQKLNSYFSANKDIYEINIKNNSIILCIGGIDELRIYKKWIPLINSLIPIGINDYILIGSENGVKLASSIMQENFEDVNILNYTGKLSILECKHILSNSKIIICADGGLMHIAVTTSTPIISFFSSTIQPEWRLPVRKNIIALSSKTENVNDIPLGLIINAINDLTNCQNTQKI